MKKIVFLLCILAISVMEVAAQKIAVKNNVAADATTSINLGTEIAVGSRSTLDFYGSFNPFRFGADRQLRHWLIQGEYRLWACEAFNGTFFGAHVLGLPRYDVAGFKLPLGYFPNLESSRYYGYGYGAGLTIGHQWILGNRWNLEASIGGGYVRFNYKQYELGNSCNLIREHKADYWGLTRVNLSLVFFFN